MCIRFSVPEKDDHPARRLLLRDHSEQPCFNSSFLSLFHVVQRARIELILNIIVWFILSAKMQFMQCDQIRSSAHGFPFYQGTKFSFRKLSITPEVAR